MPKAAEFKISTITGKKLPHVVDVSASYSHTGKRMRKSFETKKAANEFVAMLREKRRRGLEQVTFLAPHVARQAAEANALLKEVGDVSLLEAVKGFVVARRELGAVGEADLVTAARHYADARRARTESITFTRLLEQFEEAPAKKTRRPKSEKYRYQISGLRKRLDPFIGDRLVCDLDDADIEAAIRDSKVSEASKDGSYRVLKAAFNLAIQKKWARSNPVDAINWCKNEISDAMVPTCEQALALLECAEGELRAYVALCLFAGCRDSEARRLEWENLDWESEEIDLRAAPGRKAATGRFIRFESNLANWLEPLRRRSGHICGFDDGQLRIKMESLREAADERLKGKFLAEQATLRKGWQRDLMRHGAASYWAALHGIPKASAWLGHSEEIHRKHYRRPVSTADAGVFFEIAPAESQSNIIAIGA